MCHDKRVSGHSFRLAAYEFFDQSSKFAWQQAGSQAFPDPGTAGGYADFSGVKFPRHIVQTEDGHATLDITVSKVKPNAPVTIDVLANVRETAGRAGSG